MGKGKGNGGKKIVLLGGMAPSLQPATVADNGKVRLGGMAPSI